MLRATPGTTARGLDGRKLRDLMAMGSDKLIWVVNSILLLGAPPPGIVSGKTTMISKISTTSGPWDYRPTSMSPNILRMVHKMLAKMLNAECSLPMQQKGFKREEGCATNLLTIRAMVKDVKQKLSSLYVAWVDFKKAFESVGHPSLIAACKRWDLPARLTECITQLYRVAKTQLDEGPSVKIGRGVLQRNSLSPFLLNICLDWVLAALTQTIGVEVGGTTINHLAFADDVMLMASSRPGLQRLIDSLLESVAKVDLKVGVGKYSTLWIVTNKNKKTWVQDSTPFKAVGEEIRAPAPGDFYKYLGVQIGAEEGVSTHTLHHDLQVKLGRLLKAPAKP